MLEKTHIRAGAVQGAIDGFRALGLAANPIREMGLPTGSMRERESLIDTETYLELMDRCTFDVGDPESALRVGLNLNLPDFGLVGQAISAASALSDVIRDIQNLIKYFQSQSSLRITTRRNRTQICYINWHNDEFDARMDVQYTVGVLANIVMQPLYSIDPEIKLFYPYAKRGSLQHGNISVQAASSHIGIVEFDSRALGFPMPGSQLEHSEILKRFISANTAEELLSLNFTDTVRGLITSSFNVEPTSEVELASLLGINARTLRRRLAAEGTTYRDVLKQARQVVAISDLEAGYGVTETALKLGYDYPQNFTTAFQTWFGSNPSAFRGAP